MSNIWDKITGKDEPHQPAPVPPQVAQPSHAAPAPGNVNEAHPVVHESTAQTVHPKEDESSFSFSKLKDALVGGSHPEKPHQSDLPPPVAVTQNQHGNASTPAANPNDHDEWHEKFRDFLDRGVSNKHEAEEERLRLEKEAVEKEIAAKEAEEKASVKGKFKGLFKSDEEEAAEHKRLVEEALAKRREAEEAKRKENSFGQKVKDVFDNDSKEKEKERLRLEEEAKRNKSFGAQIRNIFGRDPPPPPPKADWKDKLTELTGGGAKAEAKEGKLDKAIDLYQEHILHQGPQKSESVWEQAKDNQIASGIRHALGLEKDKKDGH